MKSRERVIKTYNFELPDRIPLDFCAEEAVYKALIERVGVKDGLELMEYFHIDFRWARPQWIGPVLQTDDGVERDFFGIPRRGQGIGYPVEHPLSYIESEKDLINYPYWPKPEYYDYDIYRKEAAQFRDQGYAVYGGLFSWFFTLASDLIGMEKFLIMMMDRPDLAFKIMERITDFFYRVNEILFEKAKGFVDIFFTGDDYGQQQGPLMSRSMWVKLVKPHALRLFSLAKKHDLFITHHTCGSITNILNDLIEIGINAIEPVQVRPYDMDFKSLVKRYAGKVVLQGSIDTQKTLPFGTKEVVKKEVISRINLFKKRGGFVLGSSQHLLTDIPLENIFTMYQTAYEYGKILSHRK
jgi:uroporphyrinogen decarboxylase